MTTTTPHKPLRLVPGVHRAAHRISTYIADDARLTMSQAEAHILTHVLTLGESPIADLHAAFGHRRSTLTSIMDRLAARGFITRKPSASDRRTFIIALTAAGQKAARRALAALSAFEQQVSTHVTASELKGFDAVLRAMAAIPRRRPSE